MDKVEHKLFISNFFVKNMKHIFLIVILGILLMGCSAQVQDYDLTPSNNNQAKGQKTMKLLGIKKHQILKKE